MKKNSILDTKRRGFLKTVAHAGISTNLLRASSLASGMMLGRSALAAGENGVKRVIFVYTPGGTPFENGQSMFTPTSNLTLGKTSKPLEAVKNECVFFNNASVFRGGGHGSTIKCLGIDYSNGKKTYDVKLAETLGTTSPFPQLLLGVQSGEGNHGYASQSGEQELTYQDDPNATFRRVFGNSGGASQGSGSSGSIDIARSQSILDVQKEEIAALRSKLGADEKIRLDTHLASIERLEQRLNAQSSGGGNNGSAVASDFNASGFEFSPTDRTRFTQEADLQADLAVLALQANQTNVVSMMLGNHQCEFKVSSLDWQDKYHQSIHGAGEQGLVPFTEVRSYLSERMAYLITKLKNARDDAGNSLLDSTLVVQVTDMAEGDKHTGDNAPFFMAGGGSAVRRGQVVNNTGEHINILDTVSELLGMGGLIRPQGNKILTDVIS